MPFSAPLLVDLLTREARGFRAMQTLVELKDGGALVECGLPVPFVPTGTVAEVIEIRDLLGRRTFKTLKTHNRGSGYFCERARTTTFKTIETLVREVLRVLTVSVRGDFRFFFVVPKSGKPSAHCFTLRPEALGSNNMTL
jgi:hypothetical protein